MLFIGKCIFFVVAEVKNSHRSQEKYLVVQDIGCKDTHALYIA